MRRLRKVVLCLLLASCLTATSLAQQDVINTIVGGGPSGMPAIDANVNYPVGVAVDASGNYYFAAQSANRVYKVDTLGNLTIVAGNGLPGFGGDGVVGGAPSAMLNGPQGVAVDSAGNVYVSDTNNYVVRKVDSTGTITEFAGIPGSCAYDGDTTTDGKPATQHSLCIQEQLAFDGSGNLYIGDGGNCRVRKVTGTSISTYAGNGTCGFSGDNGTATAAELSGPYGVAADSAGNLFIGDTFNYVVREVNVSTKKINTVAGTPLTYGFSGDGGSAKLATISYGYEVAVNSTGTTVWIADSYNFRIRKFTVGGTINTVAGSGSLGFCGDGGPATAACLYYPFGIAVDSAGKLYIGDSQNYRVRQVDLSNNINTIAGNGNPTQPTPVNNVPALGTVLNAPFGIVRDPSGNAFIGDSNNYMVRELLQSSSTVDFFAGNGTYGYMGDGMPATGAEMTSPFAITRDGPGNVYIADTYNCVIRKVDTANTITTFAGSGFCGYSGDGGPATSAELYYPSGVFADAAGNIFIADTYDHVIREVTSGTINTIAGIGIGGYSGDGGPATSAKLYYPYGVSTDASGDVFIADTYNCRIREISALTQTINTVAGNGSCTFTTDGPATQVSLAYPTAVTVDVNGNTFISDTSNNRMRWVDTGGNMTTFAGGGSAPYGFGGDGGIATLATLALPNQAYEDSAGNFTFTDQNNYRVRSINAFAALNRSAASLTFGLQTVNATSAPLIEKLSVVGPLTISGITTSGDFSESDNCGVMSNGSVCTMYVFFTPKAAGIRTGSVTISDNGFFSSSQSINLTGTGTAISTTPNSVAFGNQLVHTTSAVKTVTVKNNGSTSITMGTISLTQVTDFVISSNTCPASGQPLLAKGSCVISMTFTPLSNGAKKSNLIINDSDPTTPQIVPVTGTGTSNITFSPTSLSFTTQVLNTTSKATNVTLTNKSGVSLTLGNPALAISGDYALGTATTCTNSLVIANNGTCVISVTFTPTAIGTRAGTVTVTDSDATSPQTVAITGTGTAVKFVPSSVNFGNVVKGSTVSTPVTITNVGSTTITFTNATLTGANSADFSVNNGNPPCAGSLTPGGMCTFTAFFTPSKTGAESASYTVFDNGGGTSQKLPLSGTGQ